MICNIYYILYIIYYILYRHVLQISLTKYASVYDIKHKERAQQRIQT